MEEHVQKAKVGKFNLYGQIETQAFLGVLYTCWILFVNRVTFTGSC